MANTFETVVFNEGEPLDVDKLNKVQANIKNTFQLSNSISTAFTNSTAGTQTAPYVPIMNCGYLIFPKITPNVKVRLAFDYGKSIFPDIPTVVASCRTTISDKEQISIAVVNLSGQPAIEVVSNMAHTDLRVEWIAMAKKTIA